MSEICKSFCFEYLVAVGTIGFALSSSCLCGASRGYRHTFVCLRLVVNPLFIEASNRLTSD